MDFLLLIIGMTTPLSERKRGFCRDGRFNVNENESVLFFDLLSLNFPFMPTEQLVLQDGS